MLLHPSTSAMFAAAGMLAADGRCKALDAAADGYTRGEACVTLAVEMAPPPENYGSDRGPEAGPSSGARGVLIVVRACLPGLIYKTTKNTQFEKKTPPVSPFLTVWS